MQFLLNQKIPPTLLLLKPINIKPQLRLLIPFLALELSLPELDTIFLQKFLNIFAEHDIIAAIRFQISFVLTLCPFVAGLVVGRKF